MDLVRVPRDEAVYEREAVFGRDTSSVFPKEAEKAKKAQLETIKKAVGLDSSRFITESQLEAIKKERGPSVEDGSVARDKTLAAVLAENKAKKEEQFANVWKTMKQGKNRPLDDEEMAFVNTLAEKELSRNNDLRKAEQEELSAFQEAVRKRANSHKEVATVPLKEEGELVLERTAARRKPGAEFAVKVKPVVKLSKRAGNEQLKGEGVSRKRPKTEKDKPPDAEAGDVLTGLFGNYGSDSEQ